MVERNLKATDPAAHQPTKADIGIDAAPEALAWAVTRGGAERRGPDHEGGDVMSLEKELIYFRNHQEEFAEKYPGQFVLICDQTIEGFYDDEVEAYLVAKKKFQNGAFLLRRCIRKEEETVAIFHSRVA